MARPSSLSLVDRILGGCLEQELSERRAGGDSYAAIARWLFATHDLEVTGETVRQWCRGYGIEKPEPEAASA